MQAIFTLKFPWPCTVDAAVVVDTTEVKEAQCRDLHCKGLMCQCRTILWPSRPFGWTFMTRQDMGKATNLEIRRKMGKLQKNMIPARVIQVFILSAKRTLT